MKSFKSLTYIVCVLICYLAATVNALNIETVPVCNPGNTGELSGAGAGGYGPDRICGSADYTYNIGKYEVTSRQYCEFLNAVAKTDTYGLYSINMSDTANLGCNIQRTGTAGSYSYSVAPSWANRPVNFVSWGDSARFANWLHNGQPTGTQNLMTTENGAYYLNGATSNNDLLAVSRKSDWKWAITSEDEWYKAAFHKNDGVTANYWDYPTGTDITPSHDILTPDPGNNANFYDAGYAIAAPYWRTNVGEYENSDSSYGTFDQGGNVWEWNESIMLDYDNAGQGTGRGILGGSFWSLTNDGSGESFMRASARGYYDYTYWPTTESCDIGFRVASIPEPATLLLLTLGGLALRRRKA